MIPRPPRSTLFPYTTLFRSDDICVAQGIAPKRFTETALALIAALTWPGNLAELHDTIARVEVQRDRSEEHTSELQSQSNLVCRLLLEKKKKKTIKKCYQVQQ